MKLLQIFDVTTYNGYFLTLMAPQKDCEVNLMFLPKRLSIRTKCINLKMADCSNNMLKGLVTIMCLDKY